MHPLTPVPEQERQADYVEDYSTGRGWGALVVLLVLVAALIAAVLFFSTPDVAQNPVEPVPGEAPLEPGS